MEIRLKNLLALIIPTAILSFSFLWWKRKTQKPLNKNKSQEEDAPTLVEEEIIIPNVDSCLDKEMEIACNETELNVNEDEDYLDTFDEHNFENTLSLDASDVSKRVRNQSSCDADSAFVEDYSSDGVSMSGSDSSVNKSPEHFNVPIDPLLEELPSMENVKIETLNAESCNYRDWYGSTLESAELKVLHWGSQPVSDIEGEDQRLIKEDSIGGVSIEKLSIVLDKEYNERKSKKLKSNKSPKKSKEKDKKYNDKSPTKSRSPKKSPKSSISDNPKKRNASQSSSKKEIAERKDIEKPWREQNKSPKKADEYIVYEFEIPEELCGKLIGKHGKSVREIHDKTGATVCIEAEKVGDKKRVVSIAGLLSQVQKAEKFLVSRFKASMKKMDAEMFPDLPMSLESLSLQCESCIDIIVTAIINAGNVCVQIFDSEVDANIMQLQKNLAEKYVTPPQKFIYVDKMKPKVDEICVGFIDNTWCRVKVLEYTKDEQVLVTFIDYGGVVIVPWQMLLRISHEFLQMPAQAVECYLSNVFPLPSEADYSYSANITFSQLVEGKALKAYVLSSYEDVPCVELFYFNEDTNEEVSVNQSLIKWGLVSEYPQSSPESLQEDRENIENVMVVTV